MAGGVHESQNLNNAIALQEAVLNDDGAMHAFTNTRPATDRQAEFGEAPQTLDRVNDASNKSLRCVGKLRPRVGEYLFEVG